jgi:alpha-beta hydrolase superfamily lysophospholipase
MQSLVIFSHGKESGPDGSKIVRLSALAVDRGAQTLSVDYRDLQNPDARAHRLINLALPVHDQLILVGSSMGAYVSCVASQSLEPQGMFLMAPAIGIAGYAVQNLRPTANHLSIVMGWRDEVIPIENVVIFARKTSASLHLLDTDHRLSRVEAMLDALFQSFLDEVLTRRYGARGLTSHATPNRDT